MHIQLRSQIDQASLAREYLGAFAMSRPSAGYSNSSTGDSVQSKDARAALNPILMLCKNVSYKRMVVDAFPILGQNRGSVGVAKFQISGEV